jgi:hypothetical protein
MVHLDLTADEVVLLQDLLVASLRELREEIRHTDRRDFRQELKHDAERIQVLMQRLPAEVTA